MRSRNSRLLQLERQPWVVSLWQMRKPPLITKGLSRDVQLLVPNDGFCYYIALGLFVYV